MRSAMVKNTLGRGEGTRGSLEIASEKPPSRRGVEFPTVSDRPPRWSILYELTITFHSSTITDLEGDRPPRIS
ncbi:hypothetical protein GE061_005459 [Apolygus lucorum]|uniref:Uncharacterized protein n=1 Tax=Apolygus lucorum TaxID=248454 RepID=A0A8S9WWA5_APOLU|nr:hypothetical protein GE061_005459 [Apolygus lucorum]